MWHDTMFAGCRPVCEFYNSGIISLKTQTVVSLNNFSCCLTPRLKVKRHRVVPNIVHGGSSSDWRSEELGQLNQGGRISSLGSSCRSRTRRSPYFWQGVALGFRTLSLLVQESRPVVKLSGSSSSSSLAVSLTVTTRKDVELLGLTKSSLGMQGKNLLEQERVIGDEEKLRRHRISLANKGKVPWNKGCKHSAETIKRIKEKTSQAMQSPTVIAKLRRNSRHPQTDATKLKIRDKLREKWDIKRRIRGYQEIMVKEWRKCVADSARVGGLGEEEMDWNSYSVIKKQMRVEAASLARSERAKNKEMLKVRRSSKSQEHRQRISDAIRAKWEDPDYQLKVREGMAKNINAVKPRRKASIQEKKSGGDHATSDAGVLRGPLDHGFITAVMSGEKKRQQKERAAKEVNDDSRLVSAEQTKSRARDRKVDLLKRTIALSQSVEENFTEEEETSKELSVLAAHSFVDPLSREKLFRLKLLQASRSMMDQKRREATHRAKILMAEAERAAKTLEAAAGNNELAQASLAEIHRLMAEATQFIQAADSVNKVVDGRKSHSGALWRSTMASYNSSKSQVQTKSQGEHASILRQDDNATSSSDSEAVHEHDLYLKSGQDIAMGLNSSISGTTPGIAEAMMFGSEMRETARWNMRNPFTDELKVQSRFPSAVGLLNGRASRIIGAIDEVGRKALFEKWQRSRVVTVEDENDG